MPLYPLFSLTSSRILEVHFKLNSTKFSKLAEFHFLVHILIKVKWYASDDDDPTNWAGCSCILTIQHTHLLLYFSPLLLASTFENYLEQSYMAAHYNWFRHVCRFISNSENTVNWFEFG